MVARSLLSSGAALDPKTAWPTAEEHQEKVRWFYLSFATGYEFLGAAIVRGQGLLTAIQRASDLKINPGGGVMSRPLNWRHMKRIPADLRDRLLSGEEVDTRLEVLGG